MAAPTITSHKAADSLPRPGTAAAGSPAAQQRSRNARIAGVLLSLAGAAILMGFITAEALYPGVYTTHTNTVSHLGASEPPNSVVLQPSAAIFDITMLLGVGTLGVGVFPLTHPAPHTLFAYTAFLAGGIAVVLSSRVTTAPLRYLWTTLGAIALCATVLALDTFRTWAPMAQLGEGGLERWIVYPIVLWLVAFGSYLLATPAGRSPKAGVPPV